MSQTDTDCNSNATIVKLSHDEIHYLADRLYARGISSLTTTSPVEQADLIAASRVMRRLLAAYELKAGHPLHTIMLCGV